MAGCDFFITRNGHGAGFCETPYWPEDAGKRLTSACEAFGEFDLYASESIIYN